MTPDEEKEVDKLIEQKLKDKESKALTETQPEDKPSISMPNFVPQIDPTKDLADQASDAVQVLGAQNASKDEDFMASVSKNFEKGVLTEQEAKNMKKSRLLEEEYWLKWQDVLEFVFIKSPHGLLFMKIMTVIGMLIYIPTRIIGMIVKTIGLIGNFVNEIFNSIFGGKGKYLRDKDGNVIVDSKTKKPYRENQGYNLFAKLLFGIIIGGLALALIFVFVRAFTGFDVFVWFREIL